jgi:putative peptidoglycan lipid II flippase
MRAAMAPEEGWERFRADMVDYARSAAGISALTVVSRVTGLLRVSLLAAALGLSRMADAYNVANILPNMIYEFVMGGILTAVFIPIFVEYASKKERQDEAWESANIILGFALLLLSVVTIIGVVLAPLAIKVQTLLVTDVENKRLAAFFFRFFAFEMIFYGVSAIFTGILNTYKHFWITAFAPIANNVAVIATVLLYIFVPGFGVTGLAIGTTLGVGMMAAVQVPHLLRLGMPFRPRFDLRHPLIGTVVRLALPVVGYIAINQVGLIVRTNLAYTFKGGFAAMQYGYSFFQLPYGIIAVSISTVLYPTLSEHSFKERWDEYRQTFSLGFRWITLLMMPMSLGYALLSLPVIRLLMQHGRFTGADSALLASILFFYAIGLLPYSLYMFLTRVFYSLRDTRTPTLINAIGVGINITFNLILIKVMGLEGLALCVGITYAAMLVMSLHVLRKRLGRLDGRRIILAAGKIALATAGMCAVTFWALRFVLPAAGKATILSEAASLVLIIGVSAGVFVLLTWALRLRELSSLLRSILHRS